MKIVFPGPDGQMLSVSDTRRPKPGAKPQKARTVVLTDGRRPSGWIISAYSA